jgi:hypothetical protein
MTFNRDRGEENQSRGNRSHYPKSHVETRLQATRALAIIFMNGSEDKANNHIHILSKKCDFNVLK